MAPVRRNGYRDGVEMSERPDVAAEGDAVQAEFRLLAPDYADIPATYSNFAQATVAQHDLTIYFGWYASPPLSAPPTEPVEIQVRPLMAVSLPSGSSAP